MQEPRVTKQQAIILKEIGYNLRCDEWYWEMSNFYKDGKIGFVAKPTLSKVAHWLLKVKKKHIMIMPDFDQGCNVVWHTTIWRFYDIMNPQPTIIRDEKDIIVSFPTHDTALSAGIDAVLEQIEKEVQNG